MASWDVGLTMVFFSVIMRVQRIISTLTNTGPGVEKEMEIERRAVAAVKAK